MNQLIHYASEYYDPVKAHQYYEEHKKLKGRRPSTAGFNQSQKEAASYIKARINEEKKQEISKEKEKTKSDIKSYTHSIQTKVARLRILIESGAFNDDPQKRYEVVSKIKSIKAGVSKKIEELNNNLSSNVENIKLKYDSKYENEINNIIGMGSSKENGSKSKNNIKKESETEKESEIEKKSSGSSTNSSHNKEYTSKWAERKKAKQKELWDRVYEMRKENNEKMKKETNTRKKRQSIRSKLTHYDQTAFISHGCEDFLYEKELINNILSKCGKNTIN